jgi:hypothetical protein
MEVPKRIPAKIYPEILGSLNRLNNSPIVKAARTEKPNVISIAGFIIESLLRT